MGVCLLGVYLAVPNFLSEETRKSSVISDNTLKLGLDLQGGSYLLLEVDFDNYLQDRLEILEDDVRDRLQGKTQNGKDEKIGYRGLAATKNQIRFSLRDISDISRTEERFSDMKIDIDLNITTEGEATISYRDEYLKKMRKDVVGQSIETVRRRVDLTGTREPIIQRQGDLRILLQVPGLDDPGRLKELLGRMAKMSFHLMHEDTPYLTAKKKAPPGHMLLEGYSTPAEGEAKQYYLVKKKEEVSGDSLVDASAAYDEYNRPAVRFRFDTVGGKKFAKITRENVGKPFAVVLDDGTKEKGSIRKTLPKVLTAPNINEPIPGGTGIITGNFTTQEANDLALLLRSGALPAPLNIEEERTVGPSLGQDSIDAGKAASMLGIVLVVIFMVLFYGLFGLFSDIALLINIVLIMAVLSLFEATLTLPGIAGIVLTMGMAVDANVLIFERIREEIRNGRTPFAATDYGFRQAYKTIVDSNLTTLIATLLLFIYGSGPVKGFAVTLSVGIVCSMFSAILLTRMLVVLWLKKTRPKALPI